MYLFYTSFSALILTPQDRGAFPVLRSHPEHREAESKDLLRFGKESRTRSFGTRLAARLRMTRIWGWFAWFGRDTKPGAFRADVPQSAPTGGGDDRGWRVALGGDGVRPSASRPFLNILTRFSVNRLHYRTFLQLFDSRQRTVPCPTVIHFCQYIFPAGVLTLLHR